MGRGKNQAQIRKKLLGRGGSDCNPAMSPSCNTLRALVTLTKSVEKNKERTVKNLREMVLTIIYT